MEPILTPCQQRLVAQADELAACFAQRVDAHERARTSPHENYAELHETGYLRWFVPPVYSDSGLPVVLA